MIGSKKLSYRAYVLLSLAIVLMMLAAGCKAATPEPPPVEKPPTAVPVVEEPTAAPEVSEHQAPMLAELVATGELPPLADRLPMADDIQVVVPLDTLGQYGGTWYTMSWASDIANIKMKLYEPPWRWKPDYTGYESGLARSFEMNDTCTELTWHFREGIRWSDGEPFIPKEDFGFWWEDMALNDDFKVVTVPWYLFQADGSTPMDIEFPDDYTMVWKNFKPNCIAPYIIAQGFWEFEALITPKHYLRQFHPTYNSDVTSYEDLEQMRKWWENPDFPVLFAWNVESYTAGERTILVRNPYYWKVDTEGNQLPYIDRIDIVIIPDKEVRVLELSTGRYDASFRGTDDPNDIPFLLEQAEAGGYHLQEGWMNGAGGWPMWIINQDYAPDEEIRDLLRNVKFRKGLSVALDRDRLIDVVWGGIGTPQQSTISPQAWHFASPKGQEIFKEWQQSDAQYDPVLAMAYFDEIGFVDADGDGWRDLPSGAAFELVIDFEQWGGAVVSANAVEVLAGNLEEVGISVIQNNLLGSPEWDLRMKESTFMLKTAHASEVDIWTYPDWIFPLRGGGEGSRSWPMQGKWRSSGGTEGWEPEPGSVVERLLALYDQAVIEPDEEARHQIFYEAVRIHMEEGPFNMGAAGDQPMVVVVSDKMHNISTYGVLGPWAPASPGNQHPEQYWIEQ